MKDLLFFLLFLVFVAGSYSSLGINPMMSWLGISFFGLGASIFLIQLITNASYLKLDVEGFEQKSLFHKKKYMWSEVEGFRKVNFRGNKSIVFDFTDEYNKKNSGKKLSKLLSGKRGAVTSSHNIKTENLLKLMKNYKQKNKKANQIRMRYQIFNILIFSDSVFSERQTIFLNKLYLFKCSL